MVSKNSSNNNINQKDNVQSRFVYIFEHDIYGDEQNLDSFICVI